MWEDPQLSDLSRSTCSVFRINEIASESGADWAVRDGVDISFLTQKNRFADDSERSFVWFANYYKYLQKQR